MSLWAVFISVLCVRSGRYVREKFAADLFSWFLLVPIPHMFLWLVSFSWFHIFSFPFPKAKLIRLDLLWRVFCWFLASWRARLGFVLVYTFYPPNCHLNSFLLPFVSFLSLCFFPPTTSSPAFPYFRLMFRVLFLWSGFGRFDTVGLLASVPQLVGLLTLDRFCCALWFLMLS